MSIPLPKAIADLVEASKRHDADGFLATFADDAMINDRHRPFWGKSEIAQWSAAEFIGKNITMEVSNVVDHHGDLIVNAWVDGSYSPDAGSERLELSFYFVVRDDKIVKVVILPAMGQGQEREAA
ncbi:MAG: nuclear transport factor 2 family protein [Alphaproteobacteria bacterium]|nr:nuclear transport factor 2 family protein [Alphaproteobacteria bacterium]